VSVHTITAAHPLIDVLLVRTDKFTAPELERAEATIPAGRAEPQLQASRTIDMLYV
jgi:hypothetical protein